MQMRLDPKQILYISNANLMQIPYNSDTFFVVKSYGGTLQIQCISYANGLQILSNSFANGGEGRKQMHWPRADFMQVYAIFEQFPCK